MWVVEPAVECLIPHFAAWENLPVYVALGKLHGAREPPEDGNCMF